MKRGVALPLAAVLAAVLCVSCDEFAEGQVTFRELLRLRDQIAREFHDDVIDVRVASGNRMTVKFVNSPLSARSREEKQQRADAVATFVTRNYRQPLSSVSIQFVSRSGTSAASLTPGESYTGRAAATP